MSVSFYLMGLIDVCLSPLLRPHPLPPPDGINAPKPKHEIFTLTFFLCLSFNVIVARHGHSSVVLSDGSALVMGGYDYSLTSDVWKTVNGGASWILVTSSAGWEGKKILHLSSSRPLLSSHLLLG